MLELRELLKKNTIIAAPLAGISNAAYQSLCLDYGCGLVYTEMISAEGIFFHNQRTLEMCSVPKGNHPIALQLFGAKVDHLVAAARYIDQKTDADVIDQSGTARRLVLLCPRFSVHTSLGNAVTNRVSA